MLNRRAALGGLGLGVLGSLAGGCSHLGADSASTAQASAPSKPAPLGIQLWTFREQIAAEGIRKPLQAIADIGYEQIEMFQLHGQPLHIWEEMLADLGLSAPSTHTGIEAFETEWQALAERAGRLKHEHLTLWGLPEQRRRTLDDYRRAADDMNKFGELCRAINCRLAYHNHDIEFVPIDGVEPYSVLMERTDPKLVDFEMDIYWVRKAGRDPVKLIRQYPGRFPMAHVKDMASGPDQAIADVGAGVIDFQAIFNRADAAGFRRLFVEHDSTTDPVATARASFAALRAMDLGKVRA